MRKRSGEGVLLILLDQVTKAWSIANLSTVCNTGFAFGLGQGVGSQLAVAVVLATLVLLFTFEFGGGLNPPKGSVLRVWGLLLVVAGGASNIIDRLVRGCVVDWIDVGFWPAFNLADAGIVMGVGIILANIILYRDDRQDKV